MKNTVLFWLLLPPALVSCALMMGIFFTVLALMPPVVTFVTLGVFLVVAAWFVFGRRKNRPASEGSLAGRQKSVEGLL